jgi:glycosyltransferase involved in cell wall biosynthesis
MLRVSIITVCFNAAATIESTINSVLNQSYKNIQYIVIDGKSTDNTMDVVNKYTTNISKVVSKPDNGLYEAINKGIALSDGDVVGILNADDIFYDDSIIETIVKKFNENTTTMSLIGDIAFINTSNKITRHYSSKNWAPFFLRFGVMPPHPSFYCRRELFSKHGNYRTDFKIAADFELLLRFLLINKVNYKYINQIIVLMNPGGLSTKNWFSHQIITKEIRKACQLNGIYTNYVFISFRYFFKAIQYFPRIKLLK